MDDSFSAIFLETFKNNRFCLDTSRHDFAKNVHATIDNLVKNKLVKKNGFCRILLGRKGVGKTSFLKTLQIAANAFSKSLISIYECCLDSTDSKYLSYLIYSKLSGNVELEHKKYDLNDLEKKLIEKNKYIFLVVDEIEPLFTSSCIGKEIIGELAKIAELENGRIYCIISGSSARLRQLCFAKLPTDQKVNYQNYTGLDLNSTKYCARWIHPFLEIDDFKKIVNIYKEENKEFAESELYYMYLKTCGNSRLLVNFLSNMDIDSYSVSIRNITTIEEQILTALYKCIHTYIDREFMSTDSLKELQTWTKLVELRQLKVELEPEIKNQVEKYMIYNLADRGILRFKDDDVYEGERVGFATPLIYHSIRVAERDSLDINKIVSLKYPEGQPNEIIAEEITLKCLANKVNEWIQLDVGDKEIQLNNTDVLGKLNLDSIEDKPSSISLNLNDEDENKIINRLFKETHNKRDVLGADGIILLKCIDGGFVAHRVQIKLGVSKINQQKAREICEKFKTMNKIFEESFEKAGRKLNKQYKYLVTTRYIEDAENLLTNENIILVGKKKTNRHYLAGTN
jgi:hypothetical protein